MYYPWTGEAGLGTVTSWDKVDLTASSSLLETSFYVVIYKFVLQIPDVPSIRLDWHFIWWCIHTPVEKRRASWEVWGFYWELDLQALAVSLPKSISESQTVQALNMSLFLQELIRVWLLNRGSDPPGDTTWGTGCTQGWVNSLWAQWTRYAPCSTAIHWGLFLCAPWVNIFKRSQIERRTNILCLGLICPASTFC